MAKQESRSSIIDWFIANRNSENDGTWDRAGVGAVCMGGSLWTSIWFPGGIKVAEWWDDKVCLIEPDAVDLPLGKALKKKIEARGDLFWVVRDEECAAA